MLEQVETLKLACKIDMSFDEFFSTDGHITFLNKMAAFLKIEPTRIKIVRIIPGSVNILLAISADEEAEGEGSQTGNAGGTSSKLDLTALEKKINSTSNQELSVSLGFQVSEISATHHDTKEYVKLADVGHAQRSKWLAEGEHGDVGGELQEENQ